MMIISLHDQRPASICRCNLAQMSTRKSHLLVHADKPFILFMQVDSAVELPAGNWPKMENY